MLSQNIQAMEKNKRMPDREETSIEKLRVLMIEDSEDCAALLNHILLEMKIFGDIRLFTNGEGGMAYLEEAKARASLPDLIFLDLNLPGERGLETLVKIKNYSDFNSIPVIVMTASDDRKDLLESYRKGAVFFIHKPLDKDNRVSPRMVREGFPVKIKKLF